MQSSSSSLVWDGSVCVPTFGITRYVYTPPSPSPSPSLLLPYNPHMITETNSNILLLFLPTELTAHFAPMPVPSFAAVSSGQFPEALKQPTLALASAHLVVSLALTGVLLLQAGRWWSEQKDVRPDDEEMEEWVEVDAAEVKRRRDARDGKVDGIVQEYGTETNGDRDGQGQGQGQEMPKVVKQDDVKLATPPVKAVKVKNSS
jgi:hypothetical protein